MPTSLNGVIDNTTIKIGKTLNIYMSAEHAIAGTPVAGTVPPQIAYASNAYGTFSVQSAHWPALSIKFNHVGQTGYWASGWINTSDNLPLADPSTISLGYVLLPNDVYTLPLTITPQSTGVVHDVVLSAYDGASYIAKKTWSNVAASTTWSLTKAEMQSILTVLKSPPHWIRVAVTTKLDGTAVGTETITRAVGIATAPTVGAIAVSDANPDALALGLSGAGYPKYFVQGISLPKVTLSDGITAGYGTYLDRIEIKLDGTTIITDKRPSEETSISEEKSYYAPLNPSKTGNISIGLVVADLRSTITPSYSGVVLAYAPPKLTNLQVRRASDTAGTLDEAGTYIRIDGYTNRSALTVNSVDKNSATLKIYVKEKSVAEFSETPFDSKTIAAGSASQSYTITTVIDANKSYDVLVVLADGLNQTGQTLTLATQKVPFSIGKDEGIGAGKIWEAGALDIASHDGTTGGIAIDGVLKTPWPWLSEIGTMQATDDFNDLADGYYLHIGFEAANAPWFGGLVLVNTVGNYKSQLVVGTGELQWRIFNGSSWLPWNIAMDGTLSVDSLAEWIQSAAWGNHNQLLLRINNLAGTDDIGMCPTFNMLNKDTPSRQISMSVGTGMLGVGTSGPFFQFQSRGGTRSFERVLVADKSPPASSVSFGEKGDIAYDSSYMYVCIATDTWKRIPWGTW